MEAKISVLGGCGHVGLPLGIVFALRGADVTLIDADLQRVQAVAGGEMPFFEHGADQDLAAALATGRLRATTERATLADSDCVIVTIGTPVDEFLDPSVRAFDRALDVVLD